ncbi:hypothetical protein GGS23DRAFT_598008 [Durotheca rogersii]|uniref:uncharacterized protein n=1 Tax=Durotheca rogersii TaxID=419775 RepID=UPI00221F4B30|nr:uncharacterized protein GGS23DRAFT_598008 [Durotheca rogersii]KAI5861992.1 hypothetical protein GGS23DRAFT_598008 [Durotheca rogersii]
MAPTRERLLQTAGAFIDSVNEWTPESVVRHFSPNFTFRTAPAKVKMVPQSQAECVAFVGLIGRITRTFQLQLVSGEDPLVDEVSRKVVMHLKSHSETTVGLYQNEYIWVVTLSPDGSEVDDVLNFADSQYANEWVPKMVAAAKAVAQEAADS